MTTYPGLNEDFLDLLRALQEADVQFLVVGAHALAVHGIVRATGDLDCFVQPTRDNAAKVFAALGAFGAPLESHGISVEDFHKPGTIYQIGLPPRRIDVLTEISGVTFENAWKNHVTVEVEGLCLPFIGRSMLIQNKKASGRPKDLADLASLEATPDVE